ncbi:hypothetical protein K1719_029168 [Acacia pycnantha]|nr:hypothetical protein K1719_029168 [Acacia pycnantha]
MLQSDPSTFVVDDAFAAAMAYFYHTSAKQYLFLCFSNQMLIVWLLLWIPLFCSYAFYALVLGGTNFCVLGVQLRCQFLLSWEHLITSSRFSSSSFPLMQTSIASGNLYKRFSIGDVTSQVKKSNFDSARGSMVEGLTSSRKRVISILRFFTGLRQPFIRGFSSLRVGQAQERE